MIIPCSLVEVNTGIFPSDLGQRLISELSTRYRQGSRGAIKLDVAVSPTPGSYGKNEPVSAAVLHRVLTETTGDVRDPPKVGILYASAYAIPNQVATDSGILGVMFDRGFKTNDDSSDVYEPPRLGCAVFVDTIRRWRKADQVADEIVFTSLHELGHVFNLGHVLDTPNIMHTSQSSGPFPVNEWRFLTGRAPDQQGWLANCDTDSSVTPGGSKYLGDDTTAYNNPDHARDPTPEFGIELRIDVHPREFWHFEPVQLDISIRTLGKQTPIELPDEIDPGYNSFRIFIENSRGERYLYRSPTIFCGALGSREIVHKPFERDIPLFGRAGGYTFLSSGIHRVHAELALPTNSRLRSNTVEVLVRQDAPSAREWRNGRFLTRDKIGRLLFYKHGAAAARDLKSLQNWLEAGRADALQSQALIKYLWAVTILKQTPKQSRTRGVASQILHEIRDATSLGNHRRNRIVEILGSRH